MLVTVWQISGRALNVDDFIDQFKVNPYSVYRKGEKSFRGRIHDQSGLGVLVSENVEAAKHLREVEEFIRKNKAAIMYIKANGYDSCLSMGCTVGTKKQFTKSIAVTAVQLGLLNEHGLSLEFSAYPAGDEE